MSRLLEQLTDISEAVSRTRNGDRSMGAAHSGAASSNAFRTNERTRHLASFDIDSGKTRTRGQSKALSVDEFGVSAAFGRVPDDSSQDVSSSMDASLPTVLSPMLFACLGNLPAMFRLSSSLNPSAYLSRDFQKLPLLRHHATTSLPRTVFPSSERYPSQYHRDNPSAFRNPASSESRDVSSSRAHNQRHVPLAPGSYHASATRSSYPLCVEGMSHRISAISSFERFFTYRSKELQNVQEYRASSRASLPYFRSPVLGSRYHVRHQDFSSVAERYHLDDWRIRSGFGRGTESFSKSVATVIDWASSPNRRSAYILGNLGTRPQRFRTYFSGSRSAYDWSSFQKSHDSAAAESTFFQYARFPSPVS